MDKMQEVLNLVQEIKTEYGRMLTLEDVSRYLGVDMGTVKELVKSGEIRSFQVNGEFKVKPVQLAEFEMDVTEVPLETPVPLMERREIEVMKVTEGSFYNTNSKANPLELCYYITFDDGMKKKVKIRGASKEEIQQRKEGKTREVLETYRREKEISNKRQPGKVPVAPVSRKYTFREVSDMWFKAFEIINESKGNSYANHESSKYSLKAVNKVIGDMDIRDIDTDTAQEMIRTVSKDDKGEYRSESYVMKIMRNFKSVMGYALENGYTNIPIGKVYLNKNLKEPDKDSRFINMKLLRELLECVDSNPFYSTLVNLMLSTGVRQEEALALTTDDIIERGGLYQIYVRRAVVEQASNQYVIIDRLKHGERARYISITKEIYDMVINYYKEDISDTGRMKNRVEHGTEKLIFVNKEGNVHNKRTLHRSFTGYLERNLKSKDKVSLHMLRHTFASLMKQEIPLNEVSEILGHRDMAITRKFYDTQTWEDQRRAGEGVKNMLKKIKGE